jgi:hypothetical protein
LIINGERVYFDPGVVMGPEFLEFGERVMSERRIVVPDGMLKAATDAACTVLDQRHEVVVGAALEAALRWLADNPPLPEIKQLESLWNSLPDSTGQYPYWQKIREVMWQWQTRVFLAVEPEVPEEVKDLLLVDAVNFEIPNGAKLYGSAADRNAAIIEAFRRGQKAGK